MGIIRVGTCSWTEKTLITSGEFYPEGVSGAEERLRYYASLFDTVEVDSTYYSIPPARNPELWAKRTPKGFIFHIKAYGALTGHAVDPLTVPAGLRKLMPTPKDPGKKAYVKDRAAIKSIAEAFTNSLMPLKDSGKLGLVVFQYPPWFSYKEANIDYIIFCRDIMGGLPIAVEFRNGTWLTRRHRDDVFTLMRENGITYVTADEPQYGTLETVPFLPGATTDTAYVRLHGRNMDAWNKKGVQTHERYDYLYTKDELAVLAREAKGLSLKAEMTYMMFNNCHGGFAVKNAGTMKEMLKS